MRDFLRRLIFASVGIVLFAGLSWAQNPTTPAAATPEPQTTSAPAANTSETIERWYILEMMKSKCGWMHSTETTTPETITTETTTKFTVKRGPIEINAEMESVFIETADGKPIRMRSVQKLGTMPVDQTYVFKDDGLELTSKQGDQETTKMLPKPEGTWLTPAAADRFIKARRAAGAKEISVRVIDPSSGVQPVTTKYALGEPTKLKVHGKEIDCATWNITVSGENIPNVKSIEYVDAEDVTLRTETSIGGIGVVMRLSTKKEATAEAVAPEMMVSTLVKPDRTIPNARDAKRATYVLSIPEGELPKLPPSGSQTVVSIDEKSARITVDASMPNAAPNADWKDAKYLASTSMTDLEDEQITKLKDRAVKEAGEDPAERAEAIRQFVHRYIRKKGLDVGFATASETARSRAGDCSEHGVLLAALLRADGIPARVASGLVYADAFAGGKDIFGYHMWAQALLDVDGVKKWVDLDGTFPDELSYDATHIALGMSDLADGEIAGGMMQLATLLGRLEIKVESVK